MQQAIRQRRLRQKRIGAMDDLVIPDGEVLTAEGQGEAAAAAAPPTQDSEDMTVAMRRRPGEERRGRTTRKTAVADAGAEARAVSRRPFLPSLQMPARL